MKKIGKNILVSIISIILVLTFLYFQYYISNNQKVFKNVSEIKHSGAGDIP